MPHESMPVIWYQDDDPSPAVGQLVLSEGHATLAGATGHASRHLEFDAGEVEAFELTSPRARLNNRPTVALTLRHRGRLLIAEVIGFGVAAEIANYLALWQAGPPV